MEGIAATAAEIQRDWTNLSEVEKKSANEVVPVKQNEISSESDFDSEPHRP